MMLLEAVVVVAFVSVILLWKGGSGGEVYLRRWWRPQGAVDTPTPTAGTARGMPQQKVGVSEHRMVMVGVLRRMALLLHICSLVRVLAVVHYVVGQVHVSTNNGAIG